MSDDQKSGGAARELPLLTLHRFSEQLGISRGTAWKYHRAGWLKTVVIGRRRYVTSEGIAEFNARAVRGEFGGKDPRPVPVAGKGEA